MRKVIILGLTIALASAAGAKEPAAAPDRAIERQTAVMTQVKLLVLQHRAAEAIPLAEQIIAEGDARVAAEQRRIYSGQSPEMLMANMLMAAADKQDAIDVGPPYGEALFYKGYALVDIGRADEAGLFLDRAVRVSPSNAQFLCEDAAWHAGHRDLDGAFQLYQRCRSESGLMPAAGRAQYDAAGLRGQGFVLIEQEKLDEAEAIYRERLKAEPGDAKAKNELLYIRQQREKAARAKT